MSTSSHTILEIIEKVDSKAILLPPLQRKFVWSEEKIISLFDSMMRGYPFGVFLFWNISTKREINEYHYYEFIKDYSAKDSTINDQAGKVAKNSIDVVMDGQQRLSSFYIGLKGSITNIEKRKKKSIAENWKKKRLYFKPFTSPEERDENDKPYRFVFLEDSYVEEWNKDRNDKDKYYLVADYYDMSRKELYKTFGVQRINKNEENWKYNLERLRQCINDTEIIHVHTIRNTNLVDVLEIFKRINNGGTVLSPANLMFSTLIASWEEGREKMDDFIAEINSQKVLILKEDYLIRTCLYVLNKPASAKVEMLTKDTVKEIKKNWERIKKAIINTKEFLKKRNIYCQAIRSYNAIMPIIYFYYHYDYNLSNRTLNTSEQQLFYFFAISQMFSLFGGSSATTLDAVRKKMCKDGEKKLGKLKVPFKLQNLYDINLSAGRIHAFKIDKNQIEKKVDSIRYGDQLAYCMLSLLQPEIRINSGEYDIDHVCSTDELKEISKYKKGDERKEFDEKRNLISNLQLLDYRQNRGDKNADSLYTWVVVKKHTIAHDPYLNKDSNLYKIKSMKDYLKFYEERRKLIISYLCDCFGIEE